MKAEAGFISSEKERLGKQCSKLTEQLKSKEEEIQNRVDEIQKKLDSKVTEYQLIISNMSSQTENLTKNFQVYLPFHIDFNLLIKNFFVFLVTIG